MALISAAAVVHPTASSGHTRVAVIDSPTRGTFEVRDHGGDRPGGEARRLWRGSGRREAERRLEGWLAYHRTLGFRDQLTLPSGWQGYVAAMGGLADPPLPADRLGRWGAVPVESVNARAFATLARSGSYRIERLPVPADEMRRIWLVIHADGSVELRDVETLRVMRAGTSIGKTTEALGRALRAMAPLVIETAIGTSDGRLAGPIVALDLLLGYSGHVAGEDYDERRRALGALLTRAGAELAMSEQLSLEQLRAIKTAHWNTLRLIPAAIPYDPADQEARQLVVGR